MRFCFHNFPWSSAKYILIEKCALLGYYAANSGNILQTFQDNQSVLSGVKNSKEDGKDRLSQTSVRNLLIVCNGRGRIMEIWSMRHNQLAVCSSVRHNQWAVCS